MSIIGFVCYEKKFKCGTFYYKIIYFLTEHIFLEVTRINSGVRNLCLNDSQMQQVEVFFSP